MARRYARDNRGRFASRGGGATARGGRLKTASGKKRATQTMQASAAPKGTIGKPKGLKPGAIKAKSARGGRRRPTATESKAAGLTPISEIKARRAAVGAANDATRLRRVQSNMSRNRAKQVLATSGKQRAPFGRFSTIKNPAQEGSFPQMAPGRSGIGMAQAAKGRLASSSTSKPKANKRSKTETQVLQQADRLMGKLSKRQAKAVSQVGQTGLNEGLRQVRRNNALAGRVNRALASRGLLGKYQRLTAPADFVHMTPAGKGIKPAKPRRKMR
jgi:hypothetical protein